MKGKLVCYHFGKIDPSRRMMFHKEMYGYKDFSNRGKYLYQRKGVLNTVKHRKILDCVILTDERGARTIVKILRKYQAKTFVFSVLTPSMG